MALRTYCQGGWEVERAVPGGPYPCSGLALSYTVTGTLAPDATGVFNWFGYANGRPTYKLDGAEWYIWSDGDFPWNWWLTTVPGFPGVAHWKRSDPNILGVYSPLGTATGDATVAVTV